jgi:hypothetical protein
MSFVDKAKLKNLMQTGKARIPDFFVFDVKEEILDGLDDSLNCLADGWIFVPCKVNEVHLEVFSHKTEHLGM